MTFRDRVEAGRLLGDALEYLAGEDTVVLGLPRGGVPVAFEVARRIGAPLDIILVRKLGVPFQPELGMGAIGEDGVCIVNRDVLRMAGVSETELTAVERREAMELERRARQYRGSRPRVSLVGRVAVVVDDGIATGSTAKVACLVARAHGARRVVLAVPVAPRSSIARLEDAADEVVCLETPENFFAVGAWYRDFSQTSDEQVVRLLDLSAKEEKEKAPATSQDPDCDDPPVRDEDVAVQVGATDLAGHLTVPEVLRGFVIFAHGSGSSRHSPRNRVVASVLNEAGLGTLLFDLLTPEEERVRTRVFDIELLADRLTEVTRWLRAQPEAEHARVGYFGASTGAGAALWAAADRAADVGAVVSRGGRPDLAGPKLAEVRAPTLLIVGGLDEVVLELNRQAQGCFRCESELVVIPGATHLFGEPGALEQAANLARDWFVRHLAPERGLRTGRPEDLTSIPVAGAR